MYWNKSKTQQIKMRGSHIEQIVNYFQNKGLNKNYRIETSNALEKQIKSLTHKKTRIVFTNSPTNVCKTCDLKRYTGCKQNNQIVLEREIAKQDENMIHKYGLELNKWYLGSEVLKKIL